MFFESKHSLAEKEFELHLTENHSFPLHLHRSFEFLAQISGCTEVQIDQRSYLLRAGQAVLIFPFQSHSYKMIETGQLLMSIFSADMVPAFCHDLSRLPNDPMMEFTVTELPDTSNALLRRSFLYGICGKFDIGRCYRAVSGKENVLVDLLLYAEQHLCTPCLLRDAAKAVGYDYAYVAKLFKRKVGVPFSRYVNLLRIRQSQLLMRTTSKSITEILYLCGFGSARTFNREFAAATGLSPSAWRRQNDLTVG